MATTAVKKTKTTETATESVAASVTEPVTSESAKAVEVKKEKKSRYFRKREHKHADNDKRVYDSSVRKFCSGRIGVNKQKCKLGKRKSLP